MAANIHYHIRIEGGEGDYRILKYNQKNNHYKSLTKYTTDKGNDYE